MYGETVADIIPGEEDSTRSKILTVYSKIGATYAVYRTRERVAIQFADSAVLGAEQRQALAKLNPLRGQINGLIDGWRAAGDGGGRSHWRMFFWRSIDSHEIRAKAAMFDRRVADALTMALQGDPDHAEALLTEIKADLIEERTSVARIDYMAIAAMAAAVIVLVACLLTRDRFEGIWKFSPVARTLWLAAGAGAVGALFSTGLAMRSRQILTDLQLRENRTDAIIRIAIGAIAGPLLVGMLIPGIVTFSLGGGSFSIPFGDYRWVVVVFVAFVAGFSERLVPGLLDRASATAVRRNPLTGSTAVPSRSGPGGAATSETNPLGLQRPPESGADTGGEAVPNGDDEDGCIAEDEGDPDEGTDDSQLPPATGGVEEPVESERQS